MTLAKTNETFIVQVSLTVVTYDHKNMFIVQATDYKPVKQVVNDTAILPPLVFPVAFIQEKSDLKLHLHGQFFVQCCSSSLRSVFFTQWPHHGHWKCTRPWFWIGMHFKEPGHPHHSKIASVNGSQAWKKYVHLLTFDTM